MSCHDLLQEGRIFEARELMTQDTKNSPENDKVYEIIKNEYASLKHCQSRISKNTSWRSEKRNKNAFDTDDNIDILRTNSLLFPKDYLIKVEIADVVDLPFEILRHLNMCDLWIGCVTESEKVFDISQNIYILRLKFIHRVLSSMGIVASRPMFVKVTVFDNTKVDNTRGVMIKHLQLPPLPPKRYCSTQEFTRFLSMVSSHRRVTRSDVSFQTM